MPKATLPDGSLAVLTNCNILVGNQEILLRILPDISDQKSASYSDESIIGRSFPVKTFSHSENRSISMELHFIALEKNDIFFNLGYLRILQSAVYPRDGQGGSPYRPPPICKLKCGALLGDDGVCAILRSYSVKYPTDQVWDEETYLPYKFDVSTTWEVVYSSSDLPGAEKIVISGA